MSFFLNLTKEKLKTINTERLHMNKHAISHSFLLIGVKCSNNKEDESHRLNKFSPISHKAISHPSEHYLML